MDISMQEYADKLMRKLLQEGLRDPYHIPFWDLSNEFKYLLIKKALAATGSKFRPAAKMLNVKRTTLIHMDEIVSAKIDVEIGKHKNVVYPRKRRGGRRCSKEIS